MVWLSKHVKQITIRMTITIWYELLCSLFYEANIRSVLSVPVKDLNFYLHELQSRVWWILRWATNEQLHFTLHSLYFVNITEKKFHGENMCFTFSPITKAIQFLSTVWNIPSFSWIQDLGCESVSTLLIIGWGYFYSKQRNNDTKLIKYF